MGNLRMLLLLSTRFASWKFSLTSLMTIILLVVPLSISVLLAVGSKSTTGACVRQTVDFFRSTLLSTGGHKSLRRRLVPRLIFSLVFIGVYLFLLSRIPLPPVLKASDTFAAALARLVVLGTIILGVLSGFGAVSSAWGYLPFMEQAGCVYMRSRRRFLLIFLFGV